MKIFAIILKVILSIGVIMCLIGAIWWVYDFITDDGYNTKASMIAIGGLIVIGMEASIFMLYILIQGVILGKDIL